MLPLTYIKGFVRINKLNITILLFLLLFSILHFFKPGFLYNIDGGFRPFGVGYKHKTVIPIWLVSIILAIFCYLAVISYIMYC
jgi:hypothetical protein